MPIWLTIQSTNFSSKADIDRAALDPLSTIIGTFAAKGDIEAENIQEAANNAASHFQLPELLECARGPQLDRVKALDQLARQLGNGGKSSAMQALLGFGASLVDPGASVLPDLLRKFSGEFPLAPIWLGVFSGIWSPTRVLTDHRGLGRLIARSIVGESDLLSKPTCDVAFEEISRWLGADSNASKISLRGMAARTLNVELIPGVNCPFGIGRLESARFDTSAGQPTARVEGSENIRARPSATSGQASGAFGSFSRRIERLEATIAQLQKVESTDSLVRRLERVEGALAQLHPAGRTIPTSPQPQTDLLGDSVKGSDPKNSESQEHCRHVGGLG
ncbi:MAG: hypothetical protein WB868_12110 [Xanthobacteraceae bacterium]